jgi:hypothetical protein
MLFLKSGPAIWKKLRIEVSPENTAYMMQMKSVDVETSEAIQAALWSAFNTASYPIDIETAVFVLATFMHADPLRKHLVSDEPFVEPYGDRTQYGLSEIYDLAAAADDDGDEDEDEDEGKDKSPFDQTGGHPSDGYIDDPDAIGVQNCPNPTDPHPSNGDLDDGDAQEVSDLVEGALSANNSSKSGA